MVEAIRRPDDEYHLYTICFSHFNEKARWALAFYNVRFTEHPQLPLFHERAVRPIVQSKDTAILPPKSKHSTRYSTPCLVCRDPRSNEIRWSLHSSDAILHYLADNFAESSGRHHLYTVANKSQEVVEKEMALGEELGVSVRHFVYYMLFQRVRHENGLWAWCQSLVQFSLLGFKNGITWWKSALWCLATPFTAILLTKALRLNEAKYLRAEAAFRDAFQKASEVLEKQPFLFGDKLTAADITFACMVAPFLGISYEEGYGGRLPSRDYWSTSSKALCSEMRATRAGQWVLRLFAECRAQRSLAKPHL